ncbi:PRA1 family protein F2 [Striga hermonthica]|uniref:PRA1 family protein n=1 Tax=Striga hermonthica TaxID=68872 RepID=A0A9N7NHX0_STRHE|nr:PRA1 family protein F2 [Striga hermonthica]
MTTTYGTIPATPPSDDRRWIRSGVGTRRPWSELVALPFSFPDNLKTAARRLRANASYFHVNYAIIVLFTIFLSLLWHPLALILYVIIMVAWLFLYFLRDAPVVLCGYGVEERLVLAALSVSTVALLLTTRAVVFLVGVVAGLAVVGAHSVLRRASGDLGFDVEGGGTVVVDLKETSSASYSSASL